MSDSLRPSRLQPARLLCPWYSPDKNTGVGCHTLLQVIFLTQELNTGPSHLLHRQAGSLPRAPPGITHILCCCSVSQLCPTLCDPTDCSNQASLSLTISQSLPKFMSIASVMPFSHLSFCPQSFPASGTFPMSQLFTSDYQNTGISASPLVILMSFQG